MNVFSVELLVLDTDDIGEKELISVLEDTRYPNRCISPTVMSIKSVDIGEWEDTNPLNYSNTVRSEYHRLFGSGEDEIEERRR